MSNDKYSQLVFKINEDVAAASLIYFHGNNIEDYEKQDIVTNIKFESIITLIENKLFYKLMVDFLYSLDLSDQKYETNGNLRYDNYKGKFLFTTKNFVSFGTDWQSIHFMSKIILKDNINGVCVTRFQLSYIFNTTRT